MIRMGKPVTVPPTPFPTAAPDGPPEGRPPPLPPQLVVTLCGKGFNVANTALIGVPLAAAAAAFLANSSFSSGLDGGVMLAISLLNV